MEIELYCPSCDTRFNALASTPHDEILDRMTEEGPWYALGKGACYRDMIRAALKRRKKIGCPGCFRAVQITVRRALQLVN